MSFQSKTPEPVQKYMLLAFIGFTSWTVSDAIVRYLRDYPPGVLIFITSVASLGFLFAFSTKLGGVKESFAKPRMGLQVARGFMLALSVALGMIGFMHLDMATTFALLFAAPLVGKVASVILVREKIALISWLLTLMGFAGVLIILRPGYLPLSIGTAATLASAVTFGLGYVMGRYIGPENQTAFGMGFYQYLFMIAGSAVPAFMTFNGVTPFDLLLMACLSMFGAFGLVLVSNAFANAPSAYIAPIHYTQIIWGTIWGALLFNEYPDGWTMVGAAVIIVAGLLLIWRSHLKTRAAPESA